MQKNLLIRISTKPPVIFPFVALFHLLILCYTIWNYKEFPFPSVYWIPVLWLLLYSFFWLFVCDLKRWAALGYLGLTVLNIALHYFLKFESERSVYTPSFLLLYVFFSFFILFYFRRIRSSDKEV
ncbi:MAG TPA: hypothetical protein VL093_02625 [Flavipsychrobacter sp.]|nr:hypothetical protein [Flavipsychrobacter sp.]